MARHVDGCAGGAYLHSIGLAVFLVLVGFDNLLLLLHPFTLFAKVFWKFLSLQLYVYLLIFRLTLFWCQLAFLLGRWGRLLGWFLDYIEWMWRFIAFDVLGGIRLQIAWLEGVNGDGLLIPGIFALLVGAVLVGLCRLAWGHGGHGVLLLLWWFQAGLIELIAVSYNLANTLLAGQTHLIHLLLPILALLSPEVLQDLQICLLEWARICLHLPHLNHFCVGWAADCHFSHRGWCFLHHWLLFTHALFTCTLDWCFLDRFWFLLWLWGDCLFGRWWLIRVHYYFKLDFLGAFGTFLHSHSHLLWSISAYPACMWCVSALLLENDIDTLSLPLLFQDTLLPLFLILMQFAHHLLQPHQFMPPRVVDKWRCFFERWLFVGSWLVEFFEEMVLLLRVPIQLGT